MRERRRIRRSLLIIALIVLSPVLLIVANGTILNYGETPLAGTTVYPASDLPKSGDVVTIVAFNIAKCFAKIGRFSYRSRHSVQIRMEECARIIQTVNPDIVFLSEAIFECGPCPVNQVVGIAERNQLRFWAFGENYNMGIPFYRSVGGNAILSRWPLEPVSNNSLAGRRPFYVTRNNRRVLFCRLNLETGPILLGAMHTDSFNLENNQRQTSQILGIVNERPAILAGDFNAEPHNPSIRILEQSGLFAGIFDGQPTFPSNDPIRRIDYVLAPRSWIHLETSIMESSVSDHLPVVSKFRLP